MSYAHDHDQDLGHHDGSPSATGDHASATGTADDGDHDHTGGTATPPDYHQGNAAPSSLSYASSTDAVNSQSHQSATSGAKRRLPPHIVSAFESAWVAAGNNTPPSDVVAHLAHTHGLELQKVRTWYNNRKAKEKRQRANQTIEVSSAGVTSVEGLAATSAFVHNGQPPAAKRRRSELPDGSGAGYYLGGPGSQHMSPAGNAPMAIPSALPPGPLVPGQLLVPSPQPEHLLHTVGGHTFSIDHFPGEFSPDMFLAMRDRIIQLENYIMTLPTGAALAPGGAHAHAHHAAAHAAHASAAPALPPNVAAHLSGIVRQLKSRLEAKFLPETYAADTFDVDLAETMTVDEFIGCFDERGGVVASVMKHAAPEWAKRLMGPQMHQAGGALNDASLVSVEFVNAAPIRDLFGAGGEGGRLTVFSRARGDQVACELVKVVVLYDKESGRVFMQFGLRLAA